MREQIVVNTLVFEYRLNKGTYQHELLQELHDIGVQKVEIRREFLNSLSELQEIAETANHYGMEMFYSVPDSIFSNGKLQTDKLRNYLDEASQIRAKMVKFTKGEFFGWDDEDIGHFKQFAEAFSGIITVENDQTERDGKMKALIPFYSESREKGIPVYATFDIGNGCWVGDDPLISAREVKKFTRFLHLKDVVMDAETPNAALLGEGRIPWQKILKEFDTNTYVAIEYPCGSEPLKQLTREIETLLSGCPVN